MSGVKKTFKNIDRSLGINFAEREAIKDVRKNTILKDEADLVTKQKDLLTQQEEEIKQRKVKLNKTQLAFLKARFAIGGGAKGPSTTGTSSTFGFSSNTGNQSASDLFGKITGKN